MTHVQQLPATLTPFSLTLILVTNNNQPPPILALLLAKGGWETNSGGMNPLGSRATLISSTISGSGKPRGPDDPLLWARSSLWAVYLTPPSKQFKHVSQIQGIGELDFQG